MQSVGGSRELLLELGSGVPFLFTSWLSLTLCWPGLFLLSPWKL